MLRPTLEFSYKNDELGDPLALQIVADTARFLAMGIVSILNTVDPACVLIGGAMTFGGNETALGQRFLDQIKREVVSRSFNRRKRPH